MYVYTVYIYIYICVCVCVYVYTYIYIYMCMYVLFKAKGLYRKSGAVRFVYVLSHVVWS